MESYLSLNLTLLNDRNVTLDLGTNTDLYIGDTHVLSSGLPADMIHDWSDGSNGTLLTVVESDISKMTLQELGSCLLGQVGLLIIHFY